MSVRALQVVAGVGLGSAFAAAGYKINEGELPFGYDIAACTSGVMGSAMFARYVITKRVIPGGIMAGIAFASTAYHAYKSYQVRSL